jgi:hypothetical protein
MLLRLRRVLMLNDWEAVKSVIAEVEAAGLWREAFRSIIRIERPHPEICEGFHSMWTERGHRIRGHVRDDPLVLDALWVLLPPYTGEGRTLYRGESVARWLGQACGSAWTSREEIASIFAEGLNAVEPDGGVLLVAEAPAAAIIAGPSKHSVYLGEHEYVVDRRKLLKIISKTTFPPVRGNSCD